MNLEPRLPGIHHVVREVLLHTSSLFVFPEERFDLITDPLEKSLFLLDSSPSLPSFCVGDGEGSDEGCRGLKILHVVILHLVEAALGEGPDRSELLILRGAAEEVLLS